MQRSIALWAIRLIALVPALILSVQPARAEYPDRPVRVVVPYAAGGPTDLAARVLASKLSTRFKQPFIVDNKPGANGVIGVQNVIAAGPDGYTILLHASAGLTIYHALTKEPLFKPADLSPVSMVAFFSLVLAANPAQPFDDVKGFVAHARQHPGKLSYGSAGIGGMNHIGMEWFKDLNKIYLVHIPYRGDAPAVADMVSGQIGVGFMASSLAVPHVHAGKLKALAVTSKSRLPQLPQVRTMAEAGYPDFDLRPWLALLGPAGLPKEVVAKLNGALVEELGAEDTKGRFASASLIAESSSPAWLENYISENIARWKKVVSQAKITAQ